MTLLVLMVPGRPWLSVGVASTVMTSPLLGLIEAGGLAPMQRLGGWLALRSSETTREPAAASGLVSVLIVQVLAPRVIFQTQATETWSPSMSAVVVVACRASLVFGAAGL